MKWNWMYVFELFCFNILCTNKYHFLEMLWTSACWHLQPYIHWLTFGSTASLLDLSDWTAWHSLRHDRKRKSISQVSCCFCSLRARSWPRVLTLIQAVVRHLSLAGVDVIINPAVQLREFVSLNVLSSVWLDKTGNIFTSWMYHPILPTTAFIV